MSSKLPRTEMPCLDPVERSKNFDEVAMGYTDDMAKAEASRCLQCKKPLCRQGCPVEVRIPEFIQEIVNGDLCAAYDVLKSTNSLPAVCGRVCPQEKQCEGMCILGKKGESVAIGRLERYVADRALCSSMLPKKIELHQPEVKIACIGSGPSSLTCAGYMASRGAKVTIFEGLHEPGGVLVYGIPSFRLPKDIVASELDALKHQNVEILTNYVGGTTVTVESLFAEGYQGIFVGVGAGLPYFLDIPGENLIGVFSANEYLTRANLGRSFAFPEYDTPNYAGKNVTIFGAGNVAMDAARVAIRLGAESVHIVYRRSRAEMPAREEEIEHAFEEGVQLLALSAPVRFEAGEDGRLGSVIIQKMELGEPDDSGRCRPCPIEGSEYSLKTDLAVIALGTRANPLFIDATPEIDLNRRGYIAVNEETGETSVPNVFAGGDIVTGAATVILAMGAGRRAGMEMAKRFLGSEE